MTKDAKLAIMAGIVLLVGMSIDGALSQEDDVPEKPAAAQGSRPDEPTLELLSGFRGIDNDLLPAHARKVAGE